MNYSPNFTQSSCLSEDGAPTTDHLSSWVFCILHAAAHAGQRHKAVLSLMARQHNYTRHREAAKQSQIKVLVFQQHVQSTYRGKMYELIVKQEMGKLAQNIPMCTEKHIFFH